MRQTRVTELNGLLWLQPTPCKCKRKNEECEKKKKKEKARKSGKNWSRCEANEKHNVSIEQKWTEIFALMNEWKSFGNERTHIKESTQTKENRRTNNCTPFTKIHKCFAFDSVLILNSWIECKLLNSHDCIKWFGFCIFSNRTRSNIEYILIAMRNVNEWINSFDIWCECGSVHPNANYEFADRVISSSVIVHVSTWVLFMSTRCDWFANSEIAMKSNKQSNVTEFDQLCTWTIQIKHVLCVSVHIFLQRYFFLGIKQNG